MTSLGADATALLAAVAVAGQPTVFALVARAAQLQGDVRAALTHLRAASLVRTSRDDDDDTIEVYHPEIGRAVRQRLAPAALAELHGRLAEALSAVDGEPERLAFHWHGAGDLRRAHEAAKDAGAVAMRICAFERACAHYRLALACAPEDLEVRAKLAEALCSAGHVAEAVPLLLELAEKASKPSLARRRRREAAEHLLVGGRRAEGLRVLAPLLAEFSLDYPETDRAAQIRMKEAITRLTARGLQWTERSLAELPGREVERFEASWTLCKGAILADIVRGALFAVESAILALELGEPKGLARSLALAGAVALERGVAEGRTWLKAAGDIAAKIGDEEALGFAAICWGLVLRGRGAWGQALGELEFGLSRMSAAAAWEQSLAAASLLASLEALGEVAALGIRSLKMCKLGQDIGSARMVGLGQVYGAWTALVGGEVPLCRSLLAEVVQMQGEEMESLHIYALKVEVECALFVGDPAAAWRRVEDVWAALERSRLLDAGLRRFVALSVRARAGLALWASNEACPQHVMDVVTQDIARLGREDSEHAMPTIHLLRAGVANRRGEGNVEELLRAAISGFDALGMALHATCVRWILARRSGSAEAAAELPRAEALMRMQGVAEPARWARVMAAGVSVP
jgi:hypothetical protein